MRTARQQTAVLAAPLSWLHTAWAGAAPDNAHSRRVAQLKRVLPAIGLFLLLVIAVWPQLSPLWDRLRLAFPAIDLREARELRMVNPHYSGADRLGRPFLVTAAVGRQVPDRQDLISLETPRADLKMHRDTNIVITAANGIYQSQTQLLDLFGAVTLVHEDGTRFETATARVDVGNNSAEGSEPVTGHGPSGDLTAEGFRVLDKGATIVFTGKSDMMLRGTRPTSESTAAPAALPKPIAAAAARAEAEAKPALAAAAPAAKRRAAAKKSPAKKTAAKPAKKAPAAKR